MIEAVNLTKRYGHKTAVDNISFTVKPGTVTGFLGPNGAGKSTTMRMIMGLDKPTSGTVTVNGHPYRELSAPLCEVGALLDAKGLHGSRSARSHLRQLAASNGIPTKRVDEVLEITGLTSVAKKRVKGFSLGMGQRLGIAAALLGDPRILIFDEPVNGLDPDWPMGLRLGEADGGQHFLCPLQALAPLYPRIDERKSDIIECRDTRKQVEVLKDEADLLVARECQRIIAEPCDFLTVELVRALRRTVETAENVHQRGFSRPRGSHECSKFPASDIQIDAVERCERLPANAIEFPNAAQADRGRLLFFH